MTESNERDGGAGVEGQAETGHGADDGREASAGKDGGATVPATAATETGGGRGGRRIAVAALIIILLLAALTAAGGYWLWRQLGAIGTDQLRQSEAVQQRLDRLTSRVDAMRDDSASRAETLGRLQAVVEQLRSEQQALRQRMDRVAEQAQAAEDDWRRSEAAYLASVAVHRLRFYRDVDASLAALKAADELLAGFGGETIAARKAIAEAIDRLLAADVPETAAIASRLGELIAALDSLPLAPAPPERAAGNGAAGGGGEATGWQARLARAWERLKAGLSELVVVSSEREVVPLTTREERYFLRQNLRLELEAARLAALEGNGELYRDSLARALTWAKRYLDPEQPGVAEFIGALQALRERKVSADLPEIAPVLEPVLQW